MRLHDLIDARGRNRLARAVRKQARAEREHPRRAELYEEIAAILEDVDRAVETLGLERVRRLLAERLPLADYGPFAKSRDERVASILADLEEER